MKRKNEAHDIVMESLMGALLQLMQKKRLSEINISELCAKAGVSRVSFYRNFNSFDDILVQYLKKTTDDWWEDFIAREPDLRYEIFWQELFDLYKEHAQLIRLLQKNNVTYLLKDHIFACCGPKPEHDARTAYICAMVAGAIYGTVDEWIRRGMGDAPDGAFFREILSTAGL